MTTAEQALDLAAQYFGFGRFSDTERLCDTVLAALPANGLALHLKGLACLAQHRFGDAIELIFQAMDAEPENITVIRSIGHVWQSAPDMRERILGRKPDERYDSDMDVAAAADVTKPDQLAQLQAGIARTMRQHKYFSALALYKARIAQDPHDFDALKALAILFAGIGSWNDTLEMATRARAAVRDDAALNRFWADACLATRRFDLLAAVIDDFLAAADGQDHPRFLRVKGELQIGMGDFETGIETMRAAAAEAENPASILTRMGMIYRTLIRFQEAISCFQRAIAADPTIGETHLELGAVYMEVGDLDEAIRSLKKAAELDGDSVEPWVGMTQVFTLKDEFETALLCAQQAIRINPTSQKAFVALGNSLHTLARMEDGIAVLKRGLTYYPDDFFLWNNLGTMELYSGLNADAITSFQRAEELAPEQEKHQMRWNQALPCLMLGRLEDGWRCYEDGFAAGSRQPDRRLDVPRWQGEATDKTVMIWREQGIGDEIRFAGCYADAIARVGKAIIECEPRLETLFRRSFPDAMVRPQMYDEVEKAERLYPPDYDLQIPAGSLTLYLRPRVSDFPSRRQYLVPDPDLVAQWRARLAAMGPKPKVGLAWRSGYVTPLRSTSGYIGIEERLRPLMDGFDGVDVINLQYGDTDEERQNILEMFGVPLHHFEDIDIKNDFETLAALTTALDLVIAPNTATVSLTGALGVPFVMFSPKETPIHLGQEATFPWFPSGRTLAEHEGEQTSHLRVQFQNIANFMQERLKAGWRHGEGDPVW